MLADLQLPAQRLDARPLGPVAHQQQFGGCLAADALEDMHDVFHTLDLPEIGGVDDEALAFGADGPLEVVFFLPTEALQVNKVGNYLDLTPNVEVFVGVLAQIGRNGRDAVRSVDAERDHRFVGNVLAHQGDVRAVQGSHDGHPDALGLQNLLGHKSCRGVGDGVVYVQQVELLVLGHVHHFAGQGQFVGRILKERIAAQGHLVVEKIFVEKVEARRLGVGNKVYAVTFFGQGFTEFGGDYATAPVGRVTDNANFHEKVWGKARTLVVAILQTTARFGESSLGDRLNGARSNTLRKRPDWASFARDLSCARANEWAGAPCPT